MARQAVQPGRSECGPALTVTLPSVPSLALQGPLASERVVANAVRPHQHETALKASKRPTTIGEMPDMRVEVDGATQEEVEGIERAFRRVGLNIPPEPPSTKLRSVELPPTWIIEVYIVWKTLQPFFDSFLTEAGKDAYAAFKQCVQELVGTFGERPGFIRVIDADGSLIEIPSQIPDEALEALRNIDWSQQLPRDLFWSPRRQQWLSPLDDSSAF